MPKIIFTPWKNSAELLAVRSQFYPDPLSGSDLRVNACRTVAAWKLRGNLPHPVEATALLTDAILHDDVAKNSIFSIRATYSAAFCRFVTGLVDSKLHGQRKTMFQRAVDLGLPASFVELRHEATHRELPSLVVLRGAAQRSLEWLWDYYWAKIDLPVGATSARVVKPNSADDFAAMRAEIRHHLEQMRQAEGAEPPRKKIKSQHTESLIAQPLISICKNQEQGSHVLSRVLLEEDMLVPKERQIETSLDSAFSKWDSLLESISEGHPAFLAVLTEEMVNEIAGPNDSDVKNDPYKEGIYMWLDHILQAKTWEIHRRRLPLSYMLAACEDNPNHWTKLLMTLLQNASVDVEIPQIRDSSPDENSATEAETAADSVGGDWDELKEYGWESLDKWTSRPLGVA
ncbi:hypothetical protein VTN77DRAFT_3821 [Rasamsonia byssochlamydoides]|uniref:uncharacterized protein n=1 Tax=Rasamsonia byssochlamydoides TaxID=89139 RepID=UPI00374287E8